MNIINGHKKYFKYHFVIFLIILNGLSTVYSKTNKNLSFIERHKQIDNFSKDLLHYQYLISNADDLNYTCKSLNSKYFEFVKKNEKFKRIILSSMQYFLINKSIEWISYYSIGLDESQDDTFKKFKKYRNRYCSKNITYSSQKFLLEGWKNNYQEVKKRIKLEDHGEAKDFDFSAFYNQRFTTVISKKDQFLLYKNISIEILKKSCSWSGNIYQPSNFKLFFSSPFILQLFYENLVGLKFVKKTPKKGAYQQTKKKFKFVCKNLICRLSNKDNHFSQLYDQNPKNYKYYLTSLSCNMRKKYTSNSSDKLIESFIISKLTNIPDLLLISKSYKNIDKIYFSSINNIIDKWSSESMRKLSKNLFIEESLTYNLISHKQFYDSAKSNFKIHVDINAGELDKINQIKGKITITKEIKINKTILKWLRTESFKRNVRNPIKNKNLAIRRLTLIVQNELKKSYNQLRLAPPIDQFANLISRDLYQQIISYHGNYFKEKLKENVVVPIYFHYGIFALRYLGQLKYENTKNKR